MSIDPTQPCAVEFVFGNKVEYLIMLRNISIRQGRQQSENLFAVAKVPTK